MIEKLIHTLNNIGLTITAEEIADILWLASNLDEPELSEKPEIRTTQDQTDSHADIPKADVGKTEFQDKPVKSMPEPAKTGVYPPEPEDKKISDSGIGGLPFRSPAASALPGQLAIERALRPLMRKVPSRNRFVLDEEATLRQIAESDNWLPVMRPEPSRWLDVILLADESPSMVIWQQTISELKSLLERQGAFRNVQVWGFDTQKNQLRLHAGTGFEASQNLSRNPKELIDPSGQRLILVISDCVSKAWYDGSAAKMMSAWKNNSLIAIVQMLPHWLWERTALDYAESVYLRASYPGTVNARLEIEQSDAGFDEEAAQDFPIPVITLEPLPMSSWAKSVAGVGGKWISGVVLQASPCEDAESETSQKSLSSEDQFRLFKATASPLAQRLAGYWAAVPLTLPIMRLVQQVMMPQTPQVYLAEVFLSGLIKRQNTDDSCLLHTDMVRYDFIEGIRDILISSNLISETVNVISTVFNKVSAFIDKNTGKPLDFQALIADPSLAQDLFAKDKQPFAFVSAHVLSRLGGKYAELAKALKKQDELSVKPNITQPVKEDNIRHSELKYDINLGSKHKINTEEGILNQSDIQIEAIKIKTIGSDLSLHIQDYHFVNREDELRLTCGKNALSRILFEAPVGYGKTKLLKTIGTRLYQEGWVCIYLEIPKDLCSAIEIAHIIAEKAGITDKIFDNLKSIGYEIAPLLKRQVISKQAPGMVLLIDNIERMRENEFEILFNHILNMMNKYFELKMYCSSNHIISQWNEKIAKFFDKISFLAPFQYSDIKEAIKLCIPNIREYDLNAAYLMQITGGHPGCISQIIETFDFDKESVEQSFNNNQDSYKKNILPIINEVRQSVPESLRDIADALSIFRRYDFRLLKKILNSGIIKYAYGADKLERELTTGCPVRRNIGFIQDDIVRRLLSLRLQWENPDQFLDLCGKAAEIYESDLQSRISGLELIVIEGIYQELRLAFYQQEQTLTARKQLREAFFSEGGILKKYLDILSCKPENHDIIANFIGFLEEEKNPDWEFQFAVNFFLRHEQYSNKPYTMMVDSCKKFIIPSS